MTAVPASERHALPPREGGWWAARYAVRGTCGSCGARLLDPRPAIASHAPGAWLLRLEHPGCPPTDAVVGYETVLKIGLRSPWRRIEERRSP